jgi:hypothetical protein
MKELQIPHAAQLDPSSRELVRVWAANGQQHVSLDVGLWSDGAAWGLLLVDLAKHVARGYAQATGAETDDVLARIRDAMEAEWSHLTDTPTGGLV